MIQLMLDNPLLLLFIVAAVGYPIGRIKIGGSSLGVAAVLFVGLAVGSLHPDLKLPEIVSQLGLVLFVYTVGLSSGPGFFASFRRKGLRHNLFVLGLLIFAAALAVIAQRWLLLKPALTAGMFAGSLTNTPALAAALEHIKNFGPQTMLDQMLAEPVIGYSITYPVGVVGVMLTISLMQRVWKIDYGREAQNLHDLEVANRRLSNRTIRVARPDATRHTLHELAHQQHWDVVFGRVKRNGVLSLVNEGTCLALDDRVTVVGTPEELDRVTADLGEPSDERLELDRSKLDYRRIFVSNAKIVGHRLRDLNLPQHIGAVVTRVRRGDVEFLPTGRTVLELGDRVRVLTCLENMKAVTNFFGDSYRALSEVDILTLGLGLALGLLLGSVPLLLPGDVVFKLGLAGGPLVVALILGKLGRTGPMVWSLPYSANITIRQIGLIFFLAGVGTRAGYAFVSTLMSGGGIAIFVSGAAITCLVALATLCLGHYLLHIPMGLLTGILAGLQTQPAVLGFALEQSDNELPNIGYATVYPVTTIVKILFAQLLLTDCMLLG